MFTMVNTQNLKRIQVPQEEIRIERRNSEMEIHCVKPQILPQLNKVPTRIGFKRSIDLTISSKVRLLRSRQINHNKQAGTKLIQIYIYCKVAIINILTGHPHKFDYLSPNYLYSRALK